MAISKIYSTAIASISKIDGVTKASVGKFLGENVTQSSTFYTFDGTTGYFTTNYNLDIMANFTWFVEARLNIDKSNNGLITDATDGSRMRFYFDVNGTIRGQASDNGLITSDVKANVSDFQWHQYAYTYNGTLLKLYIDGVEIDSQLDADFIGYNVTTNNSLIIGRGILSAGDQLNGDMKTVQLYDRALSAGELLSLVSDVNAVSTNKLVDFNTNKTSTIWTDNISGFVATVTGGVTLV